jgi:hypothetical protein
MPITVKLTRNVRRTLKPPLRKDEVMQAFADTGRGVLFVTKNRIRIDLAEDDWELVTTDEELERMRPE